MLDSLVRVSRRVVWVANRFATDPQCTGRERPGPGRSERLGHTVYQSAQIGVSPRGPSRPSDPRGGDAGTAWELLCPPARQHLPRPISATPRASRGYYLPRGLQGAGEQVVALSPQKVHRAVGLSTATAVGLFPSPSPAAACPRTPAEFRGSTLWSHSFASIRFHVLLNSLFKVLFNFPSRYLFAIGLVPVFSLRWSIPPT